MYIAGLPSAITSPHRPLLAEGQNREDCRPTSRKGCWIQHSLEPILPFPVHVGLHRPVPQPLHQPFLPLSLQIQNLLLHYQH